MADRHASVEALCRPGEARKDTPDTAITYFDDSAFSLSSQPTPAQRSTDTDQAALGCIETAEDSFCNTSCSTVSTDSDGDSDPDLTLHTLLYQTSDSSSTSSSFQTPSSEGSSTETDASQDPSDQSSVITGPQTPRKGNGEVTGTSISKDIVTQNGGDKPFWRDGNTPPPCMSTINPRFDQEGHKPEPQDLEQVPYG